MVALDNDSASKPWAARDANLPQDSVFSEQATQDVRLQAADTGGVFGAKFQLR